MIKILNTRIATTIVLACLAGCSGGEYSKRVNEPEGPFSARARNAMATENPQGLLRVGEGFERSGNLQAAQNIYGQAMAAAPDLLEAQVSFARVSIALGQSERGLSILTSLLDMHPNNSVVRGEITNAYIRDGNFTAAELFLRPILDEETTSADHLILGGKIAEAAGQRARARKLFERALSKSPQNIEALKNTALSFAIEGEYATAVGILQSVMDKPAGLIDGKIALASVYALSGQLDAAMMLARGSMPLEEANQQTVFYQLLPRLSTKEKALAVMFGQVPKDAVERLTGAASK